MVVRLQLPPDAAFAAHLKNTFKAPVRNSLSRASLIAVLTYISGICGTKFSKNNFFLTRGDLADFVPGVRPAAKLQLHTPVSRRVTWGFAASEETLPVPRTSHREARNPDADAERGQIQYNHYKSKQIHSHH